MKLNCTFLLFFFSIGLIFGQQSTQYSLYHLNPYAYNPAYAGLDESLSFTGVYRTQWVGIEGNPESQNVSIHTPFYFIGGGVGLNAQNDLIGAHRNTQITLSYTKYLSVGQNGQLSLGASGGVIQQTYMGERLRTPEGEYGVGITHNDDFLPTTNISELTPTVSVGAFFKNKRLDIGLSSDNILENEFLYTLDEQDTGIKTKRHYYIYGQYQIDLTNQIMLAPMVLAKSDLTETQTNIGMRAIYNEIIFVGASYRGYRPTTNDAVVFMAGMQVNANVRFAYAYDLTLSKLKSVHSGSHELVLKYNLNRKIGAGVPPPIIYNPRSL